MSASHRSHDESVLRGYSGRIFIAITLCWAGLQFGRGVIPPLLPTIMEDLAITPFLAGIALSMLMVGNAAFQYLGGRFADAWTRKTVLAISMAVLIGGLAVLLGALTYPPFLLGVTLVGIASGLFFVPMRAALADVFVSHRGRAYGLNEGVGAVAVVLASGTAAVLLLGTTWRLAFVPAVVVVLVGLVVLHRWQREDYVVGRAEIQLRHAVRGLAADRYLLLLLAGYCLVVFSMQGAFGFLPALLQAERGFSPSLASVAYAMLYVTGAVGMPVAGTLSDRGDRLALAVVVTTVAAFGVAMMLLSTHTVLVFLAIVLFAAGILGFPPIVQSHLMDVFPDATMARDFGAFKTVYIGAGGLGPTYVGFVAGHWGYEPAFWGLAACLVLSASIVGVVWVRTGR